MSLGQFILANFPTTVQAMNLDGGGSTTFVVRGQVVNQQTNGAAPRAVIDGLLVFPLTR
jgi:exopolysaccharide biosynthesis protein